jgi:hypothetical protein
MSEIYIQRAKVLKTLRSLDDLNKQIQNSLNKQKDLLNQELEIRLEIHRLKTELFNLEKQIAQEVALSTLINTP